MNPPKHKEGDRIGKLTVTAVLEYEKRHTKKTRQWYRVECDCGNVEETNQNNLRKKKCCVECSNMNRSISEHLTKKKPSIPNFLTMRL